MWKCGCGNVKVWECGRAAIHTKHSTPTPLTAQIILLTDGGISGGEEQHITALLAGKAGNAAAKAAAACTTVFCLGIGHGVHRGLLQGMASEVRWRPAAGHGQRGEAAG